MSQTILKDVKKNISYSLILLIVCQIFIIAISPYFLFYGVEHFNGHTLSYYLNDYNFWSYAMLIFAFSIFGLIVHIINRLIKKNNELIYGALLIFSSIPTFILFVFAFLYFYQIKNIDSSKDISKIKKYSIILLIVFNIVTLVWLLFMYGLVYLLAKIFGISVNYWENSRISIITSICFGSFAIFNLALIISNYYFFKNEKFWFAISLINIFTLFLPVILGSIFAIGLLFYYKKKNFKFD